MHERAISPFVMSIPELESRRLYRRLYLMLELDGPVPEHLPRRAYRSPPWTHTVPRSIPGCFLPFSEINIRNISFPSLSDIITLLCRFQTGRGVKFHQLTWHSTDITVPSARSLTQALQPHSSRLPEVSVVASGCTDNVLLNLHALCRIDLPFASIFGGLERREVDACVLLFRALDETEYKADGTPQKHTFKLSRHGGCCIVTESCHRLKNIIPPLPPPEMHSAATLRLGPIKYDVWASPTEPGITFGLRFSVRCTGSLSDTHTLPYVHSLSFEMKESSRKLPSVEGQSRISSLIQLFHSQLSAFPRLREAKVETSRMVYDLLAETVGTPPTFGGQLQYQWKIWVSSC